MAFMIPDHPPLIEVSTSSEREFWRELKAQLSDEFYVFHSLPYLRSNAYQGEIDFLVCHHHHGMLNIECKGGGVYRDEDGDWVRTKPDGRIEEMSRSPAVQARRQVEDIVGELRGPLRRRLDAYFKAFPLVYGWAIAFPYSRLDELNLPLSIQPEVVIDADGIRAGLQAAVVEAMEFHAQKLPAHKLRLDKEQFAKFRSVISPAMSIPREVVAATIDREKDTVVKLAERQVRVLRRLLVERQLRVPGGAGTGKTVLALRASHLLAEQGEDVLLTCFNKDLAAHLQGAVAGWAELDGRIDVHHFHGLCHLADQDLGGVLEYPDRDAPAEKKKSFWRDETAFTLMQAMEEQALSIGPWDAVVVDEGQDFARSWWEVLRGCLRDADQGRQVVFYDEDQAIFDHEPCVPELGVLYPLVENFRNTQSIANSIDELVDTEVICHPGAPAGEPPTVHNQPGPAKTRRLVGKLIDDLVERDQLQYRQIAILTPHSPKNSSLQGATDLAGHPVVHDVEAWGDGVLHSTIGSFKGLESDVVILVDIDPGDERCSVNVRYVAASRAVHRLHIFEKDHWLATD